MKKALRAFGMLLMAAPAHADITHRMSSSVQLTVEGPAVQTNRIGTTYSVSAQNVTVSTPGTLGSLTSGSAVGYTPLAYTAPTDGTAWNVTQSFIEGDGITTSQTTLSNAGRFDSPVLYGNSTTQAGGYAGSLAGTIDTSGAMTLTAGGAGTTATGQFVSELTIK